MHSFVLLAYAGLAASRTFLQQLIACLNFTLEIRKIYCLYKWKSDFYELWQQHKQLKTMKLSQASFMHQCTAVHDEEIQNCKELKLSKNVM